MSDTFTPSGFTVPVGVMSMSSVADIAGQAETVVKNVMRVEPMIAGMAGMFVPGLSLVQPWIVMAAPFLEQALDALSKNNNGDVLSAFIQLIQHITAGQPNSTVLAPTGQLGPAQTSSSTQGSG